MVPGTNLRYISGMQYHPGERLSVAVIGIDGKAGFVLPLMDADRTRRQYAIPFALHPWGDAQPPQDAMDAMVAALGLRGKSVAVEHTAMRVFELLALQRAGVGSIPDAADIFSELRIVKGPAELHVMRRAAAIIDGSLEGLLPNIRPGLTERQVASMWVSEILARGAEGPAFDFIVASGPNASSPHHATGDRVLERGDLIILDGGARVGGFNSDITRTVSLGPPSPLQEAIYEAVLAANTAGRRAARPGLTGRELDAATRRVIEAAGYGPQFVHRTGHGLGMDVHEAPYISADNVQPLPVGSVFTIEPGIYLDGQTGVRIEDDVAVTEAGGESLTQSPRELITL